MIRSENRIVKSTYAIHMAGPGKATLRIVQVSDMHGKEFGRDNGRLLNLIRAAEPDVIFVTGDTLRARHEVLGAAIHLVQQIATIAPVYLVTGNHEKESPEWPPFREAALATGVHVLENSAERLTLSNKRAVTVAGVGDFNFFGRSLSRYRAALARLKGAAEGLPRPLLLLAHRPEHAALYAEAGYDLVFSGHAHGGQVRLPHIGALYAPHQGLFPRYTDGIHRIGTTRLVVSRGLGPSRFPLRVLNPPELVIVDLTF